MCGIYILGFTLLYCKKLQNRLLYIPQVVFPDRVHKP
nr:MAG TPA: hypothetical protein [Caudoviricetes sp.]